MRTTILGCLVDNLSMAETLDRIEQYVNEGGPHQHVVVNADKVVKSHWDPSLRSIINQCDLINADGMPVVWASYVLRRPLKERVTGIDLFNRIVERGAARGWGIYLLGAKQEVLEAVVKRLRLEHPNIRIVGCRNGYWTPEEEPKMVDEIRQTKPDVLFVAISSPKKEEFLAQHLRVIGASFAMGVGGTFDVVAGVVRRAPGWMQVTGLEWFYRFLQEPRRMFRRYFIEDMYFFWLLAKEAVKLQNRNR